MTDTLYIIGNGFDLHHELPTSYASFRNYANKRQSLSKWLNAIYGDAINNSEWCCIGEYKYNTRIHINNEDWQ